MHEDEVQVIDTGWAHRVYHTDPDSEGDGGASQMDVERSAYDERGAFISVGAGEIWLTRDATRTLASHLEEIANGY